MHVKDVEDVRSGLGHQKSHGDDRYEEGYRDGGLEARVGRTVMVDD